MVRHKLDSNLVGKRVEDWKKAIATSAKFLIIVLGPGKSGEGYKKRVQIRDSLKLAFPNCQVVFPEDKAVVPLVKSAVGSSTVDQEQLLFSIADIILALHVSPGVSAELTMITRDASLSSRTVAFNHIKHRKSKSFLIDVMTSLPERNVKWFSDTEYKSCSLATKRVHEIVRAFVIRPSTH